jgi:chemotaxis protein MotB
MSNERIKIVKKKHRHEEHDVPNCGAWKIAFADFMTALMTFFLLLWLLGMMDDNQRRGVSDYFKGKQSGAISGSSAVLLPFNPENENDPIEPSGKDKDSLIDFDFLKRETVDLINKIQEKSVINGQVLAEATPDGVMITLLDKTGRPMFLNGDDEPTKWAHQAIKNIMPALSRKELKEATLVIEGYTDNKKFKESDNMDNMTLSVLRADSIRHVIKDLGFDDDKIEGIRGFGNDGKDKVNRKVTLLINIAPKFDRSGLSTKSVDNVARQ